MRISGFTAEMAVRRSANRAPGFSRERILYMVLNPGKNQSNWSENVKVMAKHCMNKHSGTIALQFVLHCLITSHPTQINTKHFTHSPSAVLYLLSGYSAAEASLMSW